LYFLFFSIFWNIDFINASKNWWAAKATAQFFYKQIYRYKFVFEKSPPTEKVPHSVSPAHVGYCFFLPAHVCLCCFQSAF
jgi:hypothetical protein